MKDFIVVVSISVCSMLQSVVLAKKVNACLRLRVSTCISMAKYGQYWCTVVHTFDVLLAFSVSVNRTFQTKFIDPMPLSSQFVSFTLGCDVSYYFQIHCWTQSIRKDYLPQLICAVNATCVCCTTRFCATPLGLNFFPRVNFYKHKHCYAV